MIVDARSYTAAFANKAKGGGFEFQGEFLQFLVVLLLIALCKSRYYSSSFLEVIKI